MVSINEVAALAGVSKATVSRVINNNGYVSEKTRKKVEAVIRETGFIPSANAVSLSKGITNAVGVVVPEIDNIFYGEVLRGIISEADRHDMQLFFYDTQNSAKKEGKALRVIAQQQLMGLIIAPSVDYNLNKESRALVEQIDRLGIPVVVVDRDFEGIHWDGVFFENFQGAYIATTELINGGNHRIGILTGGEELKISRDRRRGFEQAAMDHGIRVRKKDILIGDFTTETAFRLSRQMFLSGDYPEGMLTCNNRSSIGFLKAAAVCGISIGKDIALIGIDKVPMLQEIGFPFSCISRDNQEMGRMAMQLMMERISDTIYAEKLSVAGLPRSGSAKKVAMAPYQLELNGSERRG